MKSLIHSLTALTLIAIAFLAGCKQSMVLSRVDYSQSIETVLTPNKQGVVKDMQHGLTFNILPLQYAETQDTTSVTTREIRYIRGQEGYYYITAPNYRHVYVMAPEQNRLKLKKKLKVSDSGIAQPALNQRTSYVQLVNLKSGQSWKLDPKGIQKEQAKMAENEGRQQ